MPEANVRIVADAPRAWRSSPRPGTRRTTSTLTAPPSTPATQPEFDPALALGLAADAAAGRRRGGAWFRTIEEIERRAPEQLALIYFGVAHDVGRHLAELRERLDTWAQRVESGASEEEFVAAAKCTRRRGGEGLQPRDAVWSYAGLRRYWETRGVAASPPASASSASSSPAVRSRSSAARGIAPVALALAVLDLTGSKTDLGLILAAREILLIGFRLAAGSGPTARRGTWSWSGRTSPARLQGAAATLLTTGRAEIWHLAALAAVNGAATAFYFPASAGVIPQTVPAPIPQQANALSLAINAALIGGAAMAGFLVAAFGPGWAIAIDARTFLAGAALVAAMRLPAGQSEGVGRS